MAKNTSILLGDYFDDFINQQLRSGRFSSASEVVRTALRMFEQEESKKVELIKELKKGEKSEFVKDFNRETFLKVVDSGYGEWGFRVEECENPNEGIKAITVQNILRDSDFDEIDILKIDIEGAERELFSENFEGWLPNVKVLIIEIHDYLGFYGASQSLFKAILKYDFSVYIKGESLVFIRKDIFNS